MKNIIIAVIGLGLAASISFATIQNSKIANRIIIKIEKVRSSAHRCYMSLESAKSALQALNTNFNSEIAPDDVTKLTDLFNDIITARNSLNTLISNIDRDFPSIQ